MRRNSIARKPAQPRGKRAALQHPKAQRADTRQHRDGPEVQCPRLLLDSHDGKGICYDHGLSQLRLPDTEASQHSIDTLAAPVDVADAPKQCAFGCLGGGDRRRLSER